MTKEKKYRNKSKRNICNVWMSHDKYYFYHYFCMSLLWSLYCLFVTLHNAMNVPWHILLLPLFLSVFTLAIVLSFYNPSQCDECPMPGLWKDNTRTKVKTDRNSGRSNICHGTIIALWRVMKRQYNDQSKDRQK
jgi:hypothetical protein